MLSFLRDQGNDMINAPPAGQQLRPEVNDSSRRSATESDNGTSGRGESAEFITVSARRKNVRRNTLGVAFLFGLGLLCLLFMIKNSTPKAASASQTQTDEAQIEIAIARLVGANSEMFSRMDQIIKKFYESSNVLQVPVNELVKNPFELEVFLSGLKGKVDPLEGDIGIDDETARQQQARQKAKGMQLNSIIKMQADQRNCCMIDDKILYEGDMIKGFKVVRIGENYVKLQWWDTNTPRPAEPSATELEIILKLSE